MLLMHGGPGADHTSLLPLRSLSDRFKLIFYDQRCNGRSIGIEVNSMTWENLTADAEAMRQHFGYDRWTVLGHSFGGMVAMEYALRYPRSVSRLVLLDTCGDIRWAREGAPEVLAQRGYSPSTVELARRFFNGRIAPNEMLPALMKFGSAYYYHLGPRLFLKIVVSGMRSKTQPEALIYGFGYLLREWSIMDRLAEIDVPTLILAGRYDFQFPPEHQMELAAGIPDSRLEIVESAGHNAHAEKTSAVTRAIADFLARDGIN